MIYTMRFIFYLINILLIIFSAGAFVSFLVIILLNINLWAARVEYLIVCLGIFIISTIIFVIRKNKWPVPGKDYY